MELLSDAKIAEPLFLAVIVPELVIVMPVVLLLPVLLILIVFLLDEIVPPELFVIVASVVPFTSIAVIPLAVIVPELVTVKSEVLSPKTATVLALIVDPDSTVTSTLSAVTLAAFVVAPVARVELSFTVKNSPSPSISC